MTNRRQPFGYQIYSGRITVNDSEADIVKYIFRAYIGGASFNHIKLSLLNQPVSYDGDKAWNKNMIARILGDDVMWEQMSIPRFYLAMSSRRLKAYEHPKFKQTHGQKPRDCYIN